MKDVLSNPDGVLLADSVNYLGERARGLVAVASSHGGLYAAYKAAVSGARAVILNNAGVGREDAGIACLSYCEKLGMAAAVVSHLSARIGDVKDMMRRGIISHANSFARAINCSSGITCAEAANVLKAADIPALDPPACEETRFVISDEPGKPRVICIDSASLVKEEDAGQIVITGSHGGLIGGLREKAFNVDALIAAFNDAGIGIDEAGVGRLEPLDERNIAAVTVSNMSACIGDSRSTYSDGIISRVNRKAEAMGATQKMPLKSFIENVLKKQAR